jgi:hypothetical protein
MSDSSLCGWWALDVGTLRTEYPHVQASSQDNGSRFPAESSSDATKCPRGSGSRSQLGAALGPPCVPAARAPAPGSGQLQGRHVFPRLGLPLPAQGSTEAATCPVVWGSFGATTCYLGSVSCKQINKYPLATRPS